jgi:hypothetical protein
VRRKPGVCTNALARPIAQTDADILSVIEGDVLSPDYIDQLVAMVDGAGDDVAALTRERDRLAEEVKRLVDSIAAGVPADSVAEAIRERERQLRTLDAQLLAARGARPRAAASATATALPARRRKSASCAGGAAALAMAEHSKGAE